MDVNNKEIKLVVKNLFINKTLGLNGFTNKFWWALKGKWNLFLHILLKIEWKEYSCTHLKSLA